MYPSTTPITAARVPSPAAFARRCVATLVLGVAAIAAMPTVRAQAPDPMEPPAAIIEKAATNVLARIRSDNELKSGSPAKVNQAVDELILPYVDFEKTTRLAVGRHWRQATPEQQQQLVKEFRNMLVRTYSGAVSSISPQAKVEMRPFRADAAATDVVVRTLVSDEDREAIPVDYRMEKTPQGWKIYDLNVLGVWFIENYRNQFSPVVAQSGIDGLITTLRSRNEQMKVSP
jgi:phospholipid transport system substrate-binding protein